jgi:hypothetical protein
VISSGASFDALQLVGSIGDSSNGVTLSELQALAYLSCLLAIYDGNQPDTWGYGFSVTETGAPFAREIADAVEGLRGAGWISRHDRVYRLAATGRPELEFQRTLAPIQRRIRYLEGSASAALTMPLPALTDALACEPGLRRALDYMRRKRLLDKTSIDLVSRQFDALTEALSQAPVDRVDLMVPAVVWLTYLAQGYGRPDVHAA